MIKWSYYIVLPKADTELTSSLPSASLRSKSQENGNKKNKNRPMMSGFVFLPISPVRNCYLLKGSPSGKLNYFRRKSPMYIIGELRLMC